MKGQGGPGARAIYVNNFVADVSQNSSRIKQISKRKVKFAESMVSYAASTDSDESMSDGKKAARKSRGKTGGEGDSPVSQRVSDPEAMDDDGFLEDTAKA